MMQQRGLLGGRYRLDIALGRGGMGTVWRAHDEMLGRDVAVKEVRLPRGFGDAERRVLYERTFREAKASARLSHPNIVTVHDVVNDDGRPWIVMEYVRARSLQDIIDHEGPVDPLVAAGIGRQILDAIGHAHGNGILHRDVKPGNVLITDEGRAVLTDFGIAQMDGDTTLTQTGMVLGSPAYISPERATGGGAVPASDLWSLGATLYAAVEGRPPYERSDAIATLAALMTEPLPAPRHAVQLTPVIEGLLCKDPRVRMSVQQAGPLLDDIVRAPSGRAVPDGHPAITAHAGPPGRDAGSPGSPGSRPGRWALVAGGIVVSAFLVIAVIGLLPVLRHQTLPQGFRKYQDPAGFSIAIPKDWGGAEHRAGGAYFFSPDRSAYVQVGQVAKAGGSELLEWRRQAATPRFPGYQQIRLAPLDHGPPVSDPTGARAADWEFTWNDSGTRVHVLDRGFVMNGHGYAILLSAPDRDWQTTFTKLQPVYHHFTAAE